MIPVPASISVSVTVVVLLIALSRRLRARTLATVALCAACATLGFQRLRIVDSLSLSDYCFLLATLLLIPTLMTQGSPRLRAHRLLLGAIVLMTAGGLVGTLAASSVAASLSQLSHFALLTAWFVALIAIWSPNLREVRALLWCWIGSVTLTSLYAIFGGGVDRDLNGRAYALTTHPNELAMICVLAAGPALAFVIAGRGWQRALALACSAIIPVGILFSGSRAGFFGYLAVLLVSVVIPWQRSTRAAAWAALSLAAAILLGSLVSSPTPNAVQRVFAVQNPQVQHSLSYSDNERRELLETTLDRIEQHPFTGDGFEYFLSTHDIYLQTWSSAGVIGLLGLALIILQTLRPTWLGLRGQDEDFLRGPAASLALGLSAGYAGYLVAALFQNAVADRYIWLAPALVVCLVPQFSVISLVEGRIGEALSSPLRAALALFSLPRQS